MKLPKRTVLKIAGASIGGTGLVAATANAERFKDGDSVRTTVDLNGRKGPGLDDDIKRTYPEGTQGEIMNGPETNDGYTWLGIHFPDYGEWVWCVERYLEDTSAGGCTDRYYSAQNVEDLARIIMSEASISDTPARTAVGFTVPTRMRNRGVDQVREVWDAYARNQDPTNTIRNLANDILSCCLNDNSGGSTHFYSPMSMPKEGGDTSGYDTDGGLEQTEGLNRRNYRPGWAVELKRVYVNGVKEKEFKFYR